MALVLKVIVIGDGGVGKTSILHRATEGWFDARMKLTVGVDFTIKEVQVGDWQATLQIWDLGGQVRFRDLVFSYFAGAHLAIAVFDINNRFSMIQLERWIQHFHESRGTAPIIVVGNKQDLRDVMPTSVLVAPTEAIYFAQRYHAPYLETSAATGFGIKDLFNQSAQMLSVRYRIPPNPIEEIKRNLLSEAPST